MEIPGVRRLSGPLRRVSHGIMAATPRFEVTREPKCDHHHSELSRCAVAVSEAPVMSIILTYNPVLIDERDERPFLIASVATVAIWAVAFLIAVA
jgi:hypothetical protein